MVPHGTISLLIYPKEPNHRHTEPKYKCKYTKAITQDGGILESTDGGGENTETARRNPSKFPGGREGAGGTAPASKPCFLTLICMSYWAPPGRDMVAVICSVRVAGRVARSGRKIPSVSVVLRPSENRYKCSAQKPPCLLVAWRAGAVPGCLRHRPVGFKMIS